MFWIIGGEEIFHRMAAITQSPFWQAISGQLQHPYWHGFAAYDLIFPLFLFLAGVATPYSIGRKLEQGTDRRSLLLRVIRRGLMLVLLGVIYNNGLELHAFEEIRFGSVLGRIGLAYMFANILYLYSNQRSQVIWFIALLLAYWFLLAFGSAPGFAAGDMSMEGNMVSYLDRMIMPGKLYLGIHDPEGFVSTIPAISTALLGIYIGNMLRNTLSENKIKTVLFMAVMGTGLLILAQLWNLYFPINKNLWTSSFVLQCGGFSVLLMALFYFIIDVLGYRQWAFFFKVIGMNSILIYMSGQFIDWEYTTNGFFKWFGQLIGNPWNAVAMAMLVVGVKWAFLYFLYRKKVFLRV